VVEGASDQIYLSAVLSWLRNLVGQNNCNLLPCQLEQAKGKALSGYVAAVKLLQIDGCSSVIILRDSDFKNCGPGEKRRVQQYLQRRCPNLKISVTVAEPEIEAWILADAHCVSQVCGTHYSASPTGWNTSAAIRNRLRNAKERLRTIITNSPKFRNTYKTVAPTEVEMARIFAPHFNIARAARFNSSALHFLRSLLPHLVPQACRRKTLAHIGQQYQLDKNPVFRRWFSGGSVP